MGRGGGLRHGFFGATPRSTPQAVSAHPGDDPRVAGRARTGAPYRLSPIGTAP